MLEIESQTDQTLLVCGGLFTAQGQLAGTQYLLDYADYQFDNTLDISIICGSTF